MRTNKKTVVFMMLLAVAAVIISCRACVAPEAVQTPSPEAVQEITPEPTYTPDAEEVEALARLIYGEAGDIDSDMERAAVAWCALNRVDAAGFPNTLLEVIEQPNQFSGYSEGNPVTDRNRRIAADVLERYQREKDGETDVGRVLPKTYLFYRGSGEHNYFTEEFQGWAAWLYDCDNPYEN